jgi:hypothetical protein
VLPLADEPPLFARLRRSGGARTTCRKHRANAQKLSLKLYRIVIIGFYFEKRDDLKTGSKKMIKI